MWSYPFKGSSGQKYNYTLLPIEPTDLLPEQGGIFILCVGPEANPTPILIKKTKRFRDEIAKMKQEDAWASLTIDPWGATLLFFRALGGRQWREGDCEYIDLIDSYNPVANRTPDGDDIAKSAQ
jgi:hypothetical protein